MASFKKQAELESEKLSVHTPKSQIDPHTHTAIEIYGSLKSNDPEMRCILDTIFYHSEGTVICIHMFMPNNIL